ncbi:MULTISPECIES: VOC family protein [Burkholderia]|jgi:catechol 2,3-dioxygenase-like lactoylglutathione lyase family enzyme|uniref:Glyoxalase n=2 Tax=Bacteria TaxID=2 RepID=A0A1V2VRU0_9BURK|nr:MULTISPECIES: VOC family protein [Burkholderia]AIO43189.1 glyoxalase/Bleomycin resistance /Dioxygenase superfamily protein [Burkholderia cepacia]ALV60905.1 glyoxalase [Burkholderia cenocepacia]AQQ23519.1 glyoxalase [Burkholderia cenocepacia]AQQ40325.1 glyoxalase [Burkholderia cenocepacia]AQQ44654.1 glyoxalase [Burkholderia cenocepacia]
MQLLDHVSIGVPDIDQARPFYDAVMAALGATKVYDRPNALGYGERCSANDPGSTFLAVYLDPAEIGASKRHWCFKATSREQVHAFFEAGLATGGQSDGEPGLRPQYHADYYAAFLVDPAGNRVEAVCHAAAGAGA